MEEEIGIVVVEHSIHYWLGRCPTVEGELSPEVTLLATLYGQMICAGRRTVREQEVQPGVWGLIAVAVAGGNGGLGCRRT